MEESKSYEDVPEQVVIEEEKYDNHKESLIKVGERMKDYEKKFNQYIDPSKPMIIRIDGHKFSTFTKGFKRPFDLNLH